jgi:hypothetical protein
VFHKDPPDCIEISRLHGGVPLTRSLREMADREMPHRADNSRTDQFSKARAARICAPLIDALSELLSATRLISDVSDMISVSSE